MKNRFGQLVCLCLLPVSLMSYAQMIDFTNPKIVDQMWVVNDGVMGGVSQSRVRADPEGVVIEGVVSLENNGGFASVRSAAVFDRDTTTLALKIKGDCKRYKFILRTDTSPRSAMYQAEFSAPDAWTVVRFRPNDFKASFRGRAVAAPGLVFSDVKELGILIADRQEGSFRIQLKNVSALSNLEEK
jgi:hypothetical protein